ECAYFDDEDPSALSTVDGQFTFTAANGDQLFVAYDQTTIGFEPPPSLGCCGPRPSMPQVERDVSKGPSWWM
ncbi:MAG: hypothetical protein ABIF09_12095, partial [Gemmatimonadota bacterium]